ncbi:helix-turn-helix domain-containing protein [Actinophytocola sediminis]
MFVCCLIVDVDEFLTLATRGGDGWADRTRQWLRTTIDDRVRHEADASVQPSFPDEWLVVLRSSTAPELAGRAERIAAGVHGDVRAGGEVTVTVAVGQVVRAIPEALASARRAHRAKLVLGPDQVITASAVTGERDLPAPRDVHRELSRAIGRGAADHASRLLWHWFRTALDHADGDDETVRRWLLGQVLSATAVLTGRLGTGTAADWMAVCETVPYPAITELADLHEPAAVAGWIERVVGELAGRRARTSTTLDLVRRHVDQHFTDPALNLRGVALTVGVSPYHVSHLFRSELGTTFRDYVSQRRVRQARRVLVEQPHLAMTQVARASGFGTPVQLRRVLVRETGATPSAIRQSARVSGRVSGS